MCFKGSQCNFSDRLEVVYVIFNSISITLEKLHGSVAQMGKFLETKSICQKCHKSGLLWKNGNENAVV